MGDRGKNNPWEEHKTLGTEQVMWWPNKGLTHYPPKGQQGVWLMLLLNTSICLHIGHGHNICTTRLHENTRVNTRACEHSACACTCKYTCVQMSTVRVQMSMWVHAKMTVCAMCSVFCCTGMYAHMCTVQTVFVDVCRHALSCSLGEGTLCPCPAMLLWHLPQKHTHWACPVLLREDSAVQGARRKQPDNTGA